MQTFMNWNCYCTNLIVEHALGGQWSKRKTKFCHHFDYVLGFIL